MIAQQDMPGAADDHVHDVCAAEQRVIVTSHCRIFHQNPLHLRGSEMNPPVVKTSLDIRPQAALG